MAFHMPTRRETAHEHADGEARTSTLEHPLQAVGQLHEDHGRERHGDADDRHLARARGRTAPGAAPTGYGV